MLPWLDKNRSITTLIERRGKPGVLESAMEQEAPGQEEDMELKVAAEDVLRAIEQKSVLNLAKALKAAFMIIDSMPHEEGEHIEGEEAQERK